MEVRRTVYGSPVDALAALVRSLVAYEQQHCMASAEFHARYRRGELGDAVEYIEWAGDYEHYLQLKVRIDDGIVIPAEVGELAAFRRWAMSDDFPDTGRIDYLEGTIEVDMSPEDLQTHGTLKGRLYAFVDRVVSDANLGQAFVDRARLSSPAVGLSCEPDILFVSLEALRAGRVRYRPLSEARPRRLMEVEGAADLVVEVVSDSSVGKDRVRLPPLYARAGVLELWVADGRDAELRFQIFHLEGPAYQAATVDGDGFQLSRVLGRRIRLRREPWELPDTWHYFVDEA